MKHLLILLTVLSLVGCSTAVPVKRTFPNVPEELKISCPELKETNETTKLSEVIAVVVDNYGQYHECRVKVDTWIEWYNAQKAIFESVK
jgi:hypothetical protein